MTDPAPDPTPQAIPAEILSAIERIELPAPTEPDDVDQESTPGVTGELRRLLTWWRRVSPVGDVVVADVDASDGPVNAAAALVAGAAAADRAIDAGATVVVPVPGTGDLQHARAIVALLTRKEASAVLAQADGQTDRAWMAECAAIRDAVAHATPLRSDPLALLDDVGGHRVAFVVGVLLASSARRTACIVDGTEPAAAALVADRLAFRAKAWWREGSTSTDPARRTAADRIDLHAGLPLALSDETGLGARATLALIRLLAAEPPTA